MQDQKDSGVSVQVADEPPPSNERQLKGWQKLLLTVLCIGYVTFHLMVLNVFPIETWSFRSLWPVTVTCTATAGAMPAPL